MKVLLLYPEFPDTFWSFKHALKFIRKKAALPPLGLLTVAAMLPADWAKRVVDVNVRKLREKDLAWADVVFISGMIAQQDSAHELVARCRAAGKTIVAGGPLFTLGHEQFPEVNHFVLNEAEVTLPEFLRDFARGAARRVYASSEFPDLRETPAPLWELADMQRYGSMSVQFSRGCPFDCEFCNITAMFGHRPRTKTTAQVIAELDGLRRHGWRGPVFFVDDNFIGNKRALKEELLPALIRWRKGRRGMVFYTEASINLADDEELMRMMVEAGFNQVFVGIETPEDAGLAECNKRQNQRRDLVADVKRIQRGPGGAGRIHRRVRQRHARDFCAADRVHPEKRHRHGHGRPAASHPRHEAAPAAERPGPTDWPDHRQQSGRDNQLHSANEPGNIARGLPEPDGTYLCARTVLPADPHIPTRVCAAENRRLIELALFHGVPPRQCPSRHFWPRTFPILGLTDLDFLPPALPFSSGRRSLHLRLPLPQDVPGAGAVTRPVG